MAATAPFSRQRRTTMATGRSGCCSTFCTPRQPTLAEGAHRVETDWSVAAAADDPAIEAEWSDAGSGLRFADLRVDAAEQERRIAELAEMADLLDAQEAAHGTASYIDVLMAHQVPMSDFLLHEEWARTTARRAAAL